MRGPVAQPDPKGCDSSCRSASSIEALKRMCCCLSLDEEALRREPEADLGVRVLSRAMIETHPHLFASLPVFVARNYFEQMTPVLTSRGGLRETT